MYYTAVVFLIGAEVAQTYALTRRQRGAGGHPHLTGNGEEGKA